MASKRHRGAESSSKSSHTFDRKRFINVEAAGKYKAWDNRPFIPERGIVPDSDNDGELALMIDERSWVNFAAQPGVAIAPIVKEFYANLQEGQLSTVQVRGQQVSVRSDAINAYFHLPNFSGVTHQYAEYVRNGPNYEQMIAELCKPGTKWDIKGRGAMTFPKSELSRYGKAWYAFICVRLMPTSHFSHVTKDRAVLLYSLVSGKKIDVGAVIEGSIKRYMRGGATTGGFPHPMLITALCCNAGVRWAENSAVIHPWPVIDHALIIRYKAWTGAAEHPRGLGFLVPQQNEAGPSTSSGQFDKQIRKLQKQIKANHSELLLDNSRLAERQDVISQNNNQFQVALATAFSQLNPSAGPFHFPAPLPLPVFPPEESNEEPDDEESDDE